MQSLKAEDTQAGKTILYHCSQPRAIRPKRCEIKQDWLEQLNALGIRGFLQDKFCVLKTLKICALKMVLKKQERQPYTMTRRTAPDYK